MTSQQLKTATVTVEGSELQITELNALAQIEIMEARRGMPDEISTMDNMRLAAIMCAHCVVGWEGNVEKVLKNHRLSTVLEVAQKITELSGGDHGKNSGSAPSDDSSTD